MIEEQIYKNSELPYPLTHDEYLLIDKVWKFNNCFNISCITLNDYRNKLIKKIQKKYTSNDFLEKEKILEKLYWNLRYKLYEKEINIESEIITNNKMEEIINNEIFYQSMINKIFIKSCNDDNKIKNIYYCGNNLLENNDTILLISTIMRNRNIYENIMLNSQNLNTIPIIPIIYQSFDYGLPNLNLYQPFINSDKIRKYKIDKMYYDINAINNWNILL